MAVIEIINQNALYKGYVSLCSYWVYSITTRIKTPECSFAIRHFKALIEYIPLQQGLRPWPQAQGANGGHPLIEYIPLQQGLRHIVGSPKLRLNTTYWVYSITTRIKTYQAQNVLNWYKILLSIFHYNKD